MGKDARERDMVILTDIELYEYKFIGYQVLSSLNVVNITTYQAALILKNHKYN